eukprot:5733693-Pleurochrysis_carterae.AAC.1
MAQEAYERGFQSAMSNFEDVKRLMQGQPSIQSKFNGYQSSYQKGTSEASGRSVPDGPLSRSGTADTYHVRTVKTGTPVVGRATGGS